MSSTLDSTANQDLVSKDGESRLADESRFYTYGKDYRESANQRLRGSATAKWRAKVADCDLQVR
jgi:hypothetical protein